MLRIATFIETHFWVFFIAGVVFGITVPELGEPSAFLLKPALMFMLLLVFLKLEVSEILHNIKDYKLMGYLSVFYLILIPSLAYFLIFPFDQTLALGFLLLAAVPPGTASPALTELLKGNTALSVSTVMVCSLLAPFTIPLLFQYLTPADYSVDVSSMFWTLVALIFTPLIFSHFIKKAFRPVIEKTRDYFSAINVLIIFFFIYYAIAIEQEFILKNLDQVVWQTLLLYMFFIFLHVTGYIAGFGRDKKDKISISISNAYMNNSLAIILAASFFSPPVVILVVLSEIPWGTLLGPFKHSLKYLK